MANAESVFEPKPVRIARSLTRCARNRALIAKAQITAISRQCGLNRMTVSRHLDGDDLTMREFLAVAQEAGFDPVEMLQTEIDKYETRNEPALADAGVTG